MALRILTVWAVCISLPCVLGNFSPLNDNANSNETETVIAYLSPVNGTRMPEIAFVAYDYLADLGVEAGFKGYIEVHRGGSITCRELLTRARTTITPRYIFSTSRYTNTAAGIYLSNVNYNSNPIIYNMWVPGDYYVSMTGYGCNQRASVTARSVTRAQGITATWTGSCPALPVYYPIGSETEGSFIFENGGTSCSLSATNIVNPMSAGINLGILQIINHVQQYAWVDVDGTQAGIIIANFQTVLDSPPAGATVPTMLRSASVAAGGTLDRLVYSDAPGMQIADCYIDVHGTSGPAGHRYNIVKYSFRHQLSTYLMVQSTHNNAGQWVPAFNHLGWDVQGQLTLQGGTWVVDPTESRVNNQPAPDIITPDMPSWTTATQSFLLAVDGNSGCYQ